MATIAAGAYRFNDVLTAPSSVIELDVSFKTTGVFMDTTYVANCGSLSVSENGASGGTMMSYKVLFFEPELPYVELPLDFESYFSGDPDENGWDPDAFGEGIQTITIPKDTEVSDEFELWFTANTKRPSTITYNGSTIANLFGGQSATLKCAGMKMESDVMVAVAEQNEPVLQEKTVTENGEVTPDVGYDGLSKVTVAVEGSGGTSAPNTFTIPNAIVNVVNLNAAVSVSAE